MKKIILLEIVFLFLFSFTSLANTWFNDTFEDGSCADWGGCTIESVTVYNGSYSIKHNADKLYSPTWTTSDSNFNVTFWARLVDPGNSNYQSLGIAKSPLSWDSGNALYYENSAGNCGVSHFFCDYEGGTYHNTGIAVPYGVWTKFTFEMNTSGATAYYNFYINDSIVGRNLVPRTAYTRQELNYFVHQYYVNVPIFDDFSVYNKTSAGGVTGVYLNISESSPADFDVFLNSTINFNISVNSSADFSSTLLINGKYNLTRTFTAGQNVFVSFNQTFIDGTYKYELNFSDGNGNYTKTLNKSFTVASTAPTIISSPALNNSLSYGLNNIVGQFNFSDSNFYGINITIDDIYIIFNKTNINLTEYQYNLSFNPKDYGITNGVHKLVVFASDAHTAKDIPDFKYKKEFLSKSITYEFEDGWIKITPTNKGLFNSFNTWKEKDRYIFNFKRDWTQKLIYGNNLDFEVTSSEKLDLIKSGYKGHIVSNGLNKWIDFETQFKNSEVNTQQVDERKILVSVKNIDEDNIIFNSIGGLNVINVNYTFYYGNLTEIYENNVLETDYYTFSTNFSVNGSYIQDINASLWYNGSIYYPSKTTTSEYIYFEKTIESGLITANQSNISFYWNYNISGTFNLTNTTTNKNQSVYAMFISNCTSPYNSIFINFTTFNSTNILDTNSQSLFTIWNRSSSLSRTYSYAKNPSYYHYFCLFPNWATVNLNQEHLFSKTGYNDRSYTSNNEKVTTIYTNQSIYLDLTTTTTAISTVVVDNFDSPLSGYTIKVYRYNLGTNSYQLIDSGITNSEGKVVFNLDVSSYEYMFQVYNPTGSLAYTEGKQKLTNTGYTFRVVTGTSYESILLKLHTQLDYKLIANQINKSIFFIYDDTLTNLVSLVNFSVYKINATNNDLVYSSSSVLDSNTFYVNESVSGVYNALVYVTYTEDNAVYLLDSAQIDIRKEWELFGTESVFLAMFFIGTMVLLGMTISPEVSLIISAFGMIIFYMLGFIALGTGGLMGIIISIIIIIAGIQRR